MPVRRVELICLKGCQAVRADIVRLQRGGKVVEAVALTHEECRQVLQELQEILALYGDSCRIDGEPFEH